MSARRPRGRREAPAVSMRTEETHVRDCWGMEREVWRVGRMVWAPPTKHSFLWFVRIWGERFGGRWKGGSVDG